MSDINTKKLQAMTIVMGILEGFAAYCHAAEPGGTSAIRSASLAEEYGIFFSVSKETIFDKMAPEIIGELELLDLEIDSIG